MKKTSLTRSLFLGTLAMIATTAHVRAQDTTVYGEEVRQALRGAMQDVSKSLKESRITAGEPISVLPIAGDPDRIVEGLLKLAVTDAGKNYVEGGSDPFWTNVLKEVEWDMRKGDMLDPATLVTFGKLQAPKILIYGSVRAAEVNKNRVFVEFELHASSLVTKQHIWGGVFTKRFYLPVGPNPPEGLSSIPGEIRATMQQILTKQAVESINNQAKLNGMGSVALIPLAGDVDHYATFIIRDAITNTKLSPKDMELLTLGEVRQVIREEPGIAEGILYGALRDLSQSIVSTTPRSTTYDVTAEVQACIENAAGEILWSATLQATSRYTYTLSTWDWLTTVAIPQVVAHPRFWIIAVAVVIGLIILRMMIKAGTRVR